MRKSLIELITNAVVLQYQLPVIVDGINIPRVCISTQDDTCLKQLGTNEELAAIIYNGIVEYAYNDKDIDLTKLDALQIRALQSKLKYNPNAPEAQQLAYGFHGEVLLHLLLEYFYGASKVIARGYMFSALENSETKGYDSYLMIEDCGVINLFFGEAKFYLTGYKESIKKIFENIDKVLSNEYLHRNFVTMENHDEHIDPQSKITEIINAWRDNPTIDMAEEALKYNIQLVYPMLVIFDDKANKYDELLLKVVNYINERHNTINPKLTIPYTLFFIFLPVDNSRTIKTQVLQWISQQRPIMP